MGISAEQTQKAVDLMKAAAKESPEMVEAVEDMRRQLRLEKKEFIITQWLALYAQVIFLQEEILKLKNNAEPVKPSKETK